MRVKRFVSREVVCAVVRIETVNQTSRPWTVERGQDPNRRPKGCDSSDNQFDPSCNLRWIDSHQGFAVAVTVAAEGAKAVHGLGLGLAPGSVFLISAKAMSAPLSAAYSASFQERTWFDA